jgi:hypothetical protein
MATQQQRRDGGLSAGQKPSQSLRRLSLAILG